MRCTRLLAALGAGLLSAGVVFAAAQPTAAPVQAVVSGTVHQALFAIDFDGPLGVAVGVGGEIQESTDRGASWKAVDPVPTQLALLGVGVAGDRAIAVGQTGLVLTRSSDGRWTPADSGSQQRLFSVQLNATGRAVAVGGFGTVLVSEDFGRQWRPVALNWADYAADGMEPHLYAASVDAAGVITIAGEFGLILRSRDLGQSWQLLHKGDASLFAMQLREDGIGYAVGQSGVVLHTRDHGDTWESQQSGSGALLLGVHAADDGEVVITAMREMLFSRDAGSSWKQVEAPAVKGSWYVGVAQADAQSAVLAVGQAGQIVRLDP